MVGCCHEVTNRVAKERRTLWGGQIYPHTDMLNRPNKQTISGNSRGVQKLIVGGKSNRDALS